MKFVLVLIWLSLLAGAVHSRALLEPRAKGGYVQKNSGTASFAIYSGCRYPGKTGWACPHRIH